MNKKQIDTALLELQSLSQQGRFREVYEKYEDLRQKSGNLLRHELIYFGACALLGLGHVHQAETLVSEHAVMPDSEIYNLYLQSYLYLHRARYDQALLGWTRILQLDPSRTFADRLIEKVKTGEGQVKKEIQNPEYLGDYLPLELFVQSTSQETLETVSSVNHGENRSSSRKNAPLKELSLFRIIIFPGILTLIVIGTGYFWIRYTSWTSMYGPAPDGFSSFLETVSAMFSEKVEQLPPPPITGTVIPESEFRNTTPLHMFRTKKEAIADYDTARTRIASGMVNRGRYLINRINHSNASFEIKERARLLLDFVPIVEESQLQDSPAYSRVIKEFYFYQYCQVLWEGDINAIRRDGVNANFTMFHIKLNDIEEKGEKNGKKDSKQPAILLQVKNPPAFMTMGKHVKFHGILSAMEDEIPVVQAIHVQSN